MNEHPSKAQTRHKLHKAGLKAAQLARSLCSQRVSSPEPLDCQRVVVLASSSSIWLLSISLCAICVLSGFGSLFGRLPAGSSGHSQSHKPSKPRCVCADSSFGRPKQEAIELNGPQRMAGRPASSRFEPSSLLIRLHHATIILTIHYLPASGVNSTQLGLQTRIPIPMQLSTTTVLLNWIWSQTNEFSSQTQNGTQLAPTTTEMVAKIIASRQY